MSFVARSIRVIPTAARVRPFSTTLPAYKSATETAKDALKSVDRTVSDTLVKGIDKTGMFITPEDPFSSNTDN